MNNDEGRQRFGIELDLGRLRRSAEESKKILAGIGSDAVRQGDIIDQAFGESGAARGFNTLEAAIRGAGTQIKGMDFGTAEEKIGALSYIIQQNEAVIAENVSMLNKYKQEAEAAFSNGDTGLLDAITHDIDDQITKIDELTQETEDYRNVLQAVMAVSGMGSQDIAIPRLYNSEEDIQHVEELRQKIIETTAEIARVGADGGDTSALVVSLSEMKDELNDCEISAAQAAAALGQDLGGRAAETQQSLHSLNTAIAEQQEKINTITTAVDEARANFEALQQVEGTSSDEVERAAATYDTLSESLRNAQAEMIVLQTAQETAQTEWQNVSEEINSHDSVLVKMLGGYESYSKILGKLPQPLQTAIGGIQGMTGAAKAFIATPLGAIIAAIVLALKALSTWFNSTVEGQLKFAEISGYVSGVLGQLKEIVITVGKAIFKAFSDPKQAIKDFWEVLKKNVVNRFKSIGVIASSLGKVIKAAFTLDMDGVKDGIKELTNGFLQFGTGVENVTDKVSAWAKGVHSAAAETATIARESKELEIEVSKWQKRNQELEQQKAKTRGKMYNSSLSTAERKRAQKDFEAALQEQMDAEKKFADKRIELQKRTMDLTSNTIEDENKLRDLEAQRAAIDTRQEQELASLQRRAGALNNTENSAAQKLEREKQKREQALVSIGEMEASLILYNQRQELELMKEGHNKRMQQITQERDKELNELEKLKNKFVKMNKTAGTETGEDGLTDMQRTQINQGRVNIEKTYAKSVKDLLEDELSDFLTYEQRRLKIQEDYADKRKALYETNDKGNYVVDENGNKKLRKGVTQGNVDELNRSEQEAYRAIDEQFAQREETYKAWCDEIAELTLKQLKNVLAEAEKELAELEKNGGSSDKIAVARAKVATAQKSVEKAQAKNDVSPGKRSIKEWEDLYKTLQECEREFESIGDTVGGVAGEIISTAGSIMTASLSMINGIVQLVNMSATGIKGTATAAAKAIQTVEKASVILTIISAAMSIAMQIVNLFNNDDKKQEEIEALQDRIDQLQWELDNADIVRLQENSGKAVERVKRALSETYKELLRNKIAVNDVAGAWRLLFSNVSNNAELLQKTAEKLATAYANIAYTADKALGGEKYSNAQKQLKNLAQQQLLIQEQIRNEEDKKKTDHGKIDEWNRKIEELGAQAVAIINDMVEDIIGGSSSDIAKELGDAFFDAFQAGEDYAEAWGDKVKDIVADVMKRMLVSKFLEEPLGEIFNKYKAKWFPNGNGENALDRIINSMGSFETDLNTVGENFFKVWETLPDSVKSMFEVTADATREASQKGIATAPQESVDELSGRATAIQGHTYSIAENTKIILSVVNMILQSVLNIEKHAENMAGRIESIESSVKETKDTVNDFALKGIKMI
jgi:hypothetical protein|uniref:Tape measure domain protein n=1 Tax=Myoviridae sp. ctrCp2 TaxID=2825179 RepID=A0A8S5P123_9CAUD|nr:MAG TPA: Tape measure domain protein [Myoviridae sp. ctrCp2]